MALINKVHFEPGINMVSVTPPEWSYLHIFVTYFPKQYLQYSMFLECNKWQDWQKSDNRKRKEKERKCETVQSQKGWSRGVTEAGVTGRKDSSNSRQRGAGHLLGFPAHPLWRRKEESWTWRESVGQVRKNHQTGLCTPNCPCSLWSYSSWRFSPPSVWSLYLPVRSVPMFSASTLHYNLPKENIELILWVVGQIHKEILLIHYF